MTSETLWQHPVCIKPGNICCQKEGTAPAQGATLKFYDSHADVLLLAVPNIIPDQYRVRWRALLSPVSDGQRAGRAPAPVQIIARPAPRTPCYSP